MSYFLRGPTPRFFLPVIYPVKKYVHEKLL
jgi:hypothetical protein